MDGTCDLTTKDKRYISLTSPEGDDTVNKVINNFNEILQLSKKYPNTRVTFLETPLYSIKEYNRQRGHKDLESFNDQDKELKWQVYLLNQKIREINKDIQHHSPSFTVDLVQNSIVKKGKSRKSIKMKKHNFRLYADGILPDTLLAKVWLRKIANQTTKDCYWGNWMRRKSSCRKHNIHSRQPPKQYK